MTTTGGRPRSKAFLQHEAGLRQRALGGIDEQHHAVDHRQHPLHFAAEVGVARGVDDVDEHVAVVHGGVLGQDGDAALALELVAVHRPLGHALVVAEHPALAEHRVDERGLAVIDVGDDRDVAALRVDDRRRGGLRGRIGLGHLTSIRVPGPGARGPGKTSHKMPSETPGFALACQSRVPVIPGQEQSGRRDQRRRDPRDPSPGSRAPVRTKNAAS